MASDYRQPIERALQFIAQHLDRPLRLAEVAKIAYLSAFHFHRIAACTGARSSGTLAQLGANSSCNFRRAAPA